MATAAAEWAFLNELRRVNLFDLCEQMGLAHTKNFRKIQLVDLIIKSPFEVEEVSEILEDLLASLKKNGGR
jgi:hypothetical protein